MTEENADPETTLLTYLRDTLRLCGTKLGCGEGGCGACTVMVSRVDRETDTVQHVAVNACLTPVCAVHGMAVTTVEGIGNTRTRLHPVQERIAKAHGSQCGFCTPGFVMSMYALLRNMPQPSMRQLEVAFQGNLCRCTGYRPIIEGYRTFTSEFKCGMGDKCCRVKGASPAVEEEQANLFEAKQFLPYDPSQDPIFPPRLRLTDELDRLSLEFNNDRTTWYRPTRLEEVLQLKERHPEAKIVVGNTEIGVEVKFKHFHYPVLVCTNQIRELNALEVLQDGRGGVKVGASCTLDRLQTVLEEQINARPESETRIFQAIVKMLHYFAGKQIRNVASVGGNIMTGSPISDLNPIFMAAGIKCVRMRQISEIRNSIFSFIFSLNLQSLKAGARTVKMDHTFFTGYRRTVVRPDEILASIEIPASSADQYFVALKQAKRRDDDIAIVNIGLNVLFEPVAGAERRVKELVIAYGGMAPTTRIALASCELARGMAWNEALIETLNRSLIEEFPLSEDAPGGMIQYRRSLTLSLLFKCYLEISDAIGVQLDSREVSGKDCFHTLEPQSTQLFTV